MRRLQAPKAIRPHQDNKTQGFSCFPDPHERNLTDRGNLVDVSALVGCEALTLSSTDNKRLWWCSNNGLLVQKKFLEVQLGRI